MASIWSPEIKDSPLKFVNFIFEWDKPGFPPCIILKGPVPGKKNFTRSKNGPLLETGRYYPEMFRTGRSIGPWYWKVGPGVLANFMDVIYQAR